MFSKDTMEMTNSKPVPTALPVKAQDHQWVKPDEFNLVKVGTPAGEAYVVSFIEHVLNPVAVQTPEGTAYGIEVERRIRTTVQMPVSFFNSLQRVAEDVERRSQTAESQPDPVEEK